MFRTGTLRESMMVSHQGCMLIRIWHVDVCGPETFMQRDRASVPKEVHEGYDDSTHLCVDITRTRPSDILRQTQMHDSNSQSHKLHYSTRLADFFQQI